MTSVDIDVVASPRLLVSVTPPPPPPPPPPVAVVPLVPAGGGGSAAASSDAQYSVALSAPSMRRAESVHDREPPEL